MDELEKSLDRTHHERLSRANLAETAPLPVLPYRHLKLESSEPFTVPSLSFDGGCTIVPQQQKRRRNSDANGIYREDGPSAGRLHPLSIPKRPWESIGMDNLRPVSKSASGKDVILIVIDRLTKMARFIPTYSSIINKGIANLFLQEIFRHHELPSNIVSDRDPRFTTKFWEALQKALGVQLLMSIAAHPQTNGQLGTRRLLQTQPITHLLQ